jgi:hypothetical protein
VVEEEGGGRGRDAGGRGERRARVGPEGPIDGMFIRRHQRNERAVHGLDHNGSCVASQWRAKGWCAKGWCTNAHRKGGWVHTYKQTRIRTQRARAHTPAGCTNSMKSKVPWMNTPGASDWTHRRKGSWQRARQTGGGERNAGAGQGRHRCGGGFVPQTLPIVPTHSTMCLTTAHRAAPRARHVRTEVGRGAHAQAVCERGAAPGG